jgi:hypothetical protein
MDNVNSFTDYNFWNWIERTILFNMVMIHEIKYSDDYSPLGCDAV